ncbi:TPA: capsular polysaccharide biosynthesis protein CapF [Bacillus cereus]|uniref:capsular polysaccharide biosynthesis protein CapF n=1 Tax=Bacillus cereus TaxID=1396 RepID=UPI001927A931|nr:capsular polysaccharide biosynthesis protein CapF [Bacillus cereus]MBL3765053.1 capsular polysaccharide biosynthesis protein CapF [Bacillus cereus]MBL3771410.1 capsular polysaccharide biosynthesis protein CapF [Bacillus cereus]MBL3777318.1 capsular polysaccharide biosynthesis protein CapF [Bacillus cereus]MBL3788787.1 capsular polysaccharide biosynthesis protein CapF [Bacillus cereus]BCC32339.1 capsular polysaccharide biosynthesis protein Cap8F [Bacillus cereus]
MGILVTGAKGFLGKNLVAELKNQGYKDIFEFSREDDITLLERYTKECNFVFHLAGVNRPKDENEFMEGNVGFTSQLLNLLKESGNKAPVLITSSIQAESNNSYGKSKKASEEILFNYSQDTGAKAYVYRLPNLFGKWSKPNYNTVVATFCHNISRGLDIQVNNPDVELNLCYIDDVLEEFFRALKHNPTIQDKYCVVPITHKIKLGELAQIIKSFKESRANLGISNMGDTLTKKLYSTYLSFLPEGEFAYDLKMNIDNRGSFTEFIRTAERGQVSINVSKPGITKGNHWHHTKNEKFLVVSGEGLIRFRKIDSEDIIEYHVNGKKLQVVDIPIGYTHSIVNVGENDLVTVMWVNECFNPERPDTYFLEV